jgi:hypothetical protein
MHTFGLAASLNNTTRKVRRTEEGSIARGREDLSSR